MKKLLVLSVLLGLMALPMFASDITFGGDVTYGFMSDFSGTVGIDKTDVTFDIKAAIDDFNSLTINVDGAENLTLQGISKALVTTDLGKWLGLPVGLKVNWGYDDPDANEFEDMTTYGNNVVFDFSPGEYWGWAFLASYKFLEFELAFNPGVETDQGKLLVGVAAKEPIPGLNAEFYFFQGGSTTEERGPDGIALTADDVARTQLKDFDRGQIGIDAAYKTTVSDIELTGSAAFFYDMDDLTWTDAWKWGVGLKGKYSMFTVDVGLDGNETDAFAGLTAGVDIAAMDKLSIYGGMEMSFAEGAETFQGADIGVALKPGATKIYVGYLITTQGAGEINSDFGPPPDGGFYVKFDVNY